MMNRRTPCCDAPLATSVSVRKGRRSLCNNCGREYKKMKGRVITEKEFSRVTAYCPRRKKEFVWDQIIPSNINELLRQEGLINAKFTLKKPIDPKDNFKIKLPI